MKTSIRHFIFVFVFSCFLAPTLLLAGKTGVITGLVFDDTTGIGLPSVTLAIKQAKLITISDINGNFNLTGVPEGTDTLTISFVGYVEQKVVFSLAPGEIKKITVSLKPAVTQLGEVAIFAQAKGQQRAIKEQFESPLIINVVSGAKMQEFPDANAAEAIGRLPGISLIRSNGEAFQVVVRGLSPQYNFVTLEGFQIPSTNFQNRSVDLSIMPSELFSGVEVYKALRADLDANALGGTINMRLPKAAQVQKLELGAEGGYTFLNSSFENYIFRIGYSNRFFRKKIGVSIKAFREQKDRPQQQIEDNYQGNFTKTYGTVSNTYQVTAANYLELDNNTLHTTRTSLDAILDYGNSWWDVKFFTLFNQKLDRGVQDQNQFQFNNTTYDFNINIYPQLTITNTEMNVLQNEFRIGNTTLDLSLNFSYVNTRFSEESFPFQDYEDPMQKYLNPNTIIYLTPVDIYQRIGGDSLLHPAKTVLTSMAYDGYLLIDRNKGVNLDYSIPFKISEDLKGKIKLGGKFFQLTRVSEGYGSSTSFQYSNTINRNVMLNKFGITASADPQVGIDADRYITVYNKNYTPPKFIDGTYKLPFMPNVDTLTNEQGVVTKDLKSDGELYYVSGNQAYNNTYTTTENQGAGYLLGEFDYAKKLTVIPGIRYELNNTSYSAFQILQSSTSPTGVQSATKVTTNRNIPDWFPSVNFKYNATKNFSILGAVYRSTTRPDFKDISPAVNYPTQLSSTVYANNPVLNDATAWNYDLSFSFLHPVIGLVTVSGFYKQIKDLVVYIGNYRPIQDTGSLSGAPADFTARLNGGPYNKTYDYAYIKTGSTFQSYTQPGFPVNNPSPATIKGVEFAWQTNLSYLQNLLKGIVFEINYAIIRSSTNYPFIATDVKVIPNSYYYSTRGGNLVNQPASKLNLSLGYDYKGFGIRFSYAFQDKTLTSLDSRYSVFDSYTSPIKLVDLQATQKIGHNVTIFANLTNVTKYVDNSYIGAQPPIVNNITNAVTPRPALPTYSDYYGMRGQFGIKVNL